MHVVEHEDSDQEEVHPMTLDETKSLQYYVPRIWTQEYLPGLQIQNLQR